MKVESKVWVVTGGGSGMGRELVLQLLRRSARVAAVDRNPTGLDDTAQAAGAARSRLSTHVVDITDHAAVQALPAEVVTVHGVVDGLINNAGIIQPFVPVADLDDATIHRVLDVNLLGTLNMVRAFLPHLASRPEAHLANVSSMGGFFPFPGQTMYGASKAAVRLLTEGLYAELLDTKVRVSVIFPGAVDTGISENSGLERPSTDARGGLPILSPAKAATIMIRGLEKDKLHNYVGPDSRLMSIAIKVAPRPADPVRAEADEQATLRLAQRDDALTKHVLDSAHRTLEQHHRPRRERRPDHAVICPYADVRCELHLGPATI